mgnify:CR=1 FL=1
MGVKIRIRRGIIHLIIRYNGKCTEESTGLYVSAIKAQNKAIMELAEVLRSKREMQIIAGFNGLPQADGRLSLLDYYKQFSDEKGADAKLYKAIPYVERFGGGAIMLSAVTPKWFELFQARMEKDSALAPVTAEKYCCNVRQALKRAERDGLIARNPADGIKHIRVPEKQKEALNLDEVRRMVATEYTAPAMDAALQDEIRRAFLFGCCTGFRISDIKQLQWRNVDTRAMQIAKKMQKTKRMVYVPIQQQALLLIDTGAPHDDGDLLFPHLAQTRTNTNRYIKKWAEAAGVHKNVSWHTGRHTDATLLLESGAELYTVQRLLGHTKISTTAKYAEATDRLRRQAVDALPDFGVKS